MAESAGKVFLYSQSGKIVYGIKKYIVDDESGISELPTDVHIGSSCFVIATGAVYVLNSEKKWIKSIAGGGGESGSGDGGDSSGDDDGSGDGGSSGDDVSDIVYDGGEVG